VLPEPDWEIEEDLPPPEPPEDHSAEIEARYKADEARRLASYLERQRDLTAKIAAAATGNANLNRAVDGINRQLDVLAYPNPEPIPQPPIDVPNIIAHHVRGRVAPGESFPLTLRTVHSGKKALGKSMLKQVLTPKTSNQFEPAIEKDADGFVCIDGKTATFSFIAPYPTLWVARLSFVKLPPDADQLNITKDIVFETPLRQRNWEIVIERKGEEGRICVSDVVAMTPGRIQ
jgi:hypothetical protein